MLIYIQLNTWFNGTSSQTVSPRRQREQKRIARRRNANKKQRSESKTQGEQRSSKGNNIRTVCTGYINTRLPTPFHTPSEMILPIFSTLFLPETITPRPGSCSNGARESDTMGYPPFTEADGSAGDEGDEDGPAPPDPCLSGARCIISCCPCPCPCPAPLGHPEGAEDAPLEYGGPPDPE